MRTLEAIKSDFNNVETDKILNQIHKNNRFVQLMNELERDYGAFIFNPTEEEMSLPSIKLYREISLARKD